MRSILRPDVSLASYLDHLQCPTLCLWIGFFAADAYLPHLRNWKSKKLHQQPCISIIQLMTPADYLRTELEKHVSLPSCSETLARSTTICFYFFAPNPRKLLFAGLKFYLQTKAQLKKGLSCSIEQNEPRKEMKSIRTQEASPAKSLSSKPNLRNDADWFENPENILTIAELLIETGNAKEGLKFVNQLLLNILSTRRNPYLHSVHLKDTSNLSLIGRSLATLSSQRNQTGKEAIRHMTLLHLLSPLSPESLARCLELLEANPHSQQIDFLRICALQHASSKDKEMRSDIISYCSNCLISTTTPKLSFSIDG